MTPRVDHLENTPAANRAPTDPVRSLRVAQFRAVYDANYDDVWKYCLRRSDSPEAAEEALGDTFAVVWQKLDDAPSGSATRPWVFGIARNHLRNSWRKRRSGKRLVQRLSYDRHVAAPDDPAEQATDESGDILRAMTELKDGDQELLRLSAWEELPQREIADLLGITENAVAIRLHRARERFAAVLEKQQRPTATESSRKVSSSPNTLEETESTDEKGTWS